HCISGVEDYLTHIRSGLLYMVLPVSLHRPTIAEMKLNVLIHLTLSHFLTVLHQSRHRALSLFRLLVLTSYKCGHVHTEYRTQGFHSTLTWPDPYQNLI